MQWHNIRVSRLSNLPQVDPPYPSMTGQLPLQLPVSKHIHLRSKVGKMAQESACESIVMSFPSSLTGF